MHVFDPTGPRRSVQSEQSPLGGGAAVQDEERSQADSLGGREAAATPLFFSHRKSCGQPEWREDVGYLLRAKDCRCGVCRKCAGKRGWKRALLVLMVVRTFRRWRFLTLTVDHQQFPDQGRIYRHLKQKRAVGELMRELRKRGITGRWICVQQVQDGKRIGDGRAATQQIHFHLIVETLTPTGFLDAWQVTEIWGRFRPEWGPEERGTLQNGEPRPELGMCQVPKREKHKQGGEAEVIAYVTGYLSKAGDDLPDWLLDEIGEGNAQMFSCSRDFWNGFRKEKKTEKAPYEPGRPRPKYRRRHVRKRLRHCREEADVFEVRTVTKGGEIIPGLCKSEYVGSVKGESGYARLVFGFFPFEQAERKLGSSGFFVDEAGLSKIGRIPEIRPFMSSKLRHRVDACTMEVGEEAEPIADEEERLAVRREGPDEFDRWLQALVAG